VFCLKFSDADGMIESGTRRRALNPEPRGLDGTGSPVPRKKLVDAARGTLAFRHGVDHLPATVRAIAARENVRQIGAASGEVPLDHASFVDFKGRKEFAQGRRLLLLADRSNHHVEGLHTFGAWNYLYFSQGVRASLRQAQAGNAAIISRDHLDGKGVK